MKRIMNKEGQKSVLFEDKLVKAGIQLNVTLYDIRIEAINSG